MTDGGLWQSGDTLSKERLNQKTIYVGSTEPTTTYPGQVWFDTSNNTWKVRNSDNTGWIERYNLPELQISDTSVITSSRVLQNVTADASIITSGVFDEARIPHTFSNAFKVDNTLYVETLSLKGTDGTFEKALSSTNTSPNQDFHFFADYPKQSGATSVRIMFGFNSEISEFAWYSKWSGSNIKIMALDDLGNLNVSGSADIDSLKISGTEVLSSGRVLHDITTQDLLPESSATYNIGSEDTYYNTIFASKNMVNRILRFSNAKYVEFPEQTNDADFEACTQIRIGPYLHIGNFGLGNQDFIACNAQLDYSSTSGGSQGTANIFKPVYASGKGLVCNLQYDGDLHIYVVDWAGSTDGKTFPEDFTRLLSLTPDGKLELPITGSSGGITIGGDTNLYRSAADVLKTDDNFDALALRIGGTEVITSTRTLQNVTASRSIITDFFSSPFWDNIPDKPSAFPPSAHASSHASGGSDPVSLDASQIVSGVLNTSRIPWTQVNNTFLPDTNNAYDLGSSSSRWKNLYLSGEMFTESHISIDATDIEKRIRFDTGLGDYVGFFGRPSDGAIGAYDWANDKLIWYYEPAVLVHIDGLDLQTRSIKPSGDNSHDLGTSDRRWRDLYIARHLRGNWTDSETIYVSETGGGDGSSAASPTTLDDALTRIKTRIVYIRLLDGTFHVTSNYELAGDYVEIRSHSGDNSVCKIVFDTYDDGNYNYSRRIHMRTGLLKFASVTLENADKTNSSLPWGSGGGAYTPLSVGRDTYVEATIFLSSCVVNQTRDYFISSKHGRGAVILSNTTINMSGDAVAFILTDFGTTQIGWYNSSITSGYKLTTGIQGKSVLSSTTLSSISDSKTWFEALDVDIIPTSDNTRTIGSSSNRFKNLYLSDLAYLDSGFEIQDLKLSREVTGPPDEYVLRDLTQGDSWWISFVTGSTPTIKFNKDAIRFTGSTITFEGDTYLQRSAAAELNTPGDFLVGSTSKGIRLKQSGSALDVGFLGNYDALIWRGGTNIVTLSSNIKVKTNIIPDANTLYDIGSSAYSFNAVYAKDFYGNAHYADVYFSDVECCVCNQKFKEEDLIVFKVIEVTEKEIRTLPVHLHCLKR